MLTTNSLLKTLSLLCLVVFLSCKADSTATKTTLNPVFQEFVNQHNKQLVLPTDKFTIIYVSGKDNPFAKVYDKLKDKTVKENVFLIGGFKEMMAGMDKKKKRSHLQEALLVRLGKNGSSLYIDLDSKIMAIYEIEDNAILRFENGQLIQKEQFKEDRLAFLTKVKSLLN